MVAQRAIYFYYLKLLILTLCVQMSQCFRHGEYLDSDSYKQLHNIGIKQCAKLCYADANCQSINYSKTRFTCAFCYYNSKKKQLVSDSEYIYGERSHMAQYFSAPVNCSENEMLLRMHDGRSYCYKRECTSEKSRLNWQNITDITVRASSMHPDCPIQMARIVSIGNSTTASAWCPYYSRVPYEYIEIIFNVPYRIFGVVTQGRGDNRVHWVTGYRVNSSDDAIHWTQLGGDYVGNTNFYSLVTNNFSRSVERKFLRIIPVTYFNYPSMRFDLIGCKV